MGTKAQKGSSKTDSTTQASRGKYCPQSWADFLDRIQSTSDSVSPSDIRQEFIRYMQDYVAANQEILDECYNQYKTAITTFSCSESSHAFPDLDEFPPSSCYNIFLSKATQEVKRDKILPRIRQGIRRHPSVPRGIAYFASDDSSSCIMNNKCRVVGSIEPYRPAFFIFRFRR